MAGDPVDEEVASDQVMILFMGESYEHAITSIQHFVPDAVHIVTSDKFEKSYKRRLNDWSKKYDFRKGTVQSVEDLFEETGLTSLIECIFKIGGHEFHLSEGEMETWRWKIGITGGTMIMAAAGTLLASILDAGAFYVVKPPEGKAIMPNRDIISLPEFNALKVAMTLNPTDIDYMIAELNVDEYGDLESLHDNTSIMPWMMILLQTKAGVVELNTEIGGYRLTRFGAQLLTMLASSAHHSFVRSIASEEMMLMQQKVEEFQEDTHYHV